VAASNAADALIASRVKALDPRAHCCVAFALAIGTARYAPIAAASYGQVTLPGLGAEILLALTGVYALVIDIALLCKGFRDRASVIIGSVISLVLVIGLRTERASVEAAFQNLVSNREATLLGVAIVLVPLTVPSPRWSSTSCAGNGPAGRSTSPLPCSPFLPQSGGP